MSPINQKSRHNLPLLQNMIKKDPDSYKSDFIEILEEYKDIMNTFQLNPSNHEEELVSLSMFIAQVSHCFKDMVSEYAEQLVSLLNNQGSLLDTDMRLSFCKALILMRNKNIVQPINLLQLFFKLFKCQDKLLRKTLFNYIIQDIRNVNKKHKNIKLNTVLQNFMYMMLQDSNVTASKMSLQIVIELYRRKIWNDAKTANVIATALFSKETKLIVMALKFFLVSEDPDKDDDDSDDDGKLENVKTAKELKLGHRVGKKTKKRQNRLDRALEMLKKNKKKIKKDNSSFSPIHLLHDPQELTEKLFSHMEKSTQNDVFEVKLLKLNLISQLIGIHKLILLQIYPYFERFLKPSQREVTKLLLFLAQACHELIPPDIIQNSIKTITYHFISERNSNEVMAVGLNAVREICNRCPLAMNEDLLHDLVLYKKSKDKCVLMAARSLIGLFREKNPQLLHKNFRGKPTEHMKEVRVLNYGELDAVDCIAGADVLENVETKFENNLKEEDDWESCSENEDDKDSDGSWIDVKHSSDEEDKLDKSTCNLNDEEKLSKSKEIFHSRLLTQEDFKKIKTRQDEKYKNFDKKNNKLGKRALADTSLNSRSQNENNNEVVPLFNIEGVYKKRKHDKESRLATVMAGREGRETFVKKKKKSNPHASTSNKVKNKKKNFMMVREKVLKKKNKQTFSQKKEALKKVLMKKMCKSKR